MSDETTLAASKLIGRRVLVELWGEGKLEVADEFYAPDYVDHVGRGPEASRVVGPTGIKQAVTPFRTAFPDLRYAVEADRRGRFGAEPVLSKQTGPFMGAPPSGKSVTYTGMDLNRIVRGKIVESWVNYDALALLQQLGLVPPIKGI